jgi:hypothetical protein
LRQDDPPISIEQAQIANADKERQDGRGRGEHQPDQEVVEQVLGAKELHMGKDECRHRRQGQHQEDGEPGDQERIAHLEPITLADEDVGIVGEHPGLRQPKGVAAQITERLETAQGGGDERNQHHGCHDQQRGIEIGPGANAQAAPAGGRGSGVDGWGGVSHCA